MKCACWTKISAAFHETLTVLSEEGYDPIAMLIFSCDTSTAYYSVALSSDEHVLAEVSVEGGRKHSERLLETVDWLLRECGRELNDLDMLAIAHGPGSFTGLRVGVAAWKGLALGAGLPLVGVSTLDAMSRLPEARDAWVCPILDARMQEVYGAVYRFEDGIRTKVKRESVCPIDELIDGLSGKVLFLGEGVEVYRHRIEDALPEAAFASGACAYPRASAVGFEALHVLEEGASSDPASVRPVYLRKSQAEEVRIASPRKAPTI